MPDLYVVCVKVGKKYGPEYVNRLHSMVELNLTIPHRFICYTDRVLDSGLDTGIETLERYPDTSIVGWWNKLILFKKGFLPSGHHILYLDLDVVITGSLDRFLDPQVHPYNLTVQKDYKDVHYYAPGGGTFPGYNSSVFLLTAGSMPWVWDSFYSRLRFGGPHTYLTLNDPRFGDQDWIYCRVVEHEAATKEKVASLWPYGWVVSYKEDHCEDGPLPGASVVVFHGQPKPADFATGWVKEMWR